MASLVEQLAERKGLSSEFVDAWGKPAFVTLDSKKAVLATMGYDVADEANLAKQIEEEDRQYWSTCLDPVLVLKENEDLRIEVRIPSEVAGQTLGYNISLESGEKMTGSVNLGEFCESDSYELDGRKYVKKEVILRVVLPLGYHSLELGAISKNDMRLIVVPRQCYKQPAIADGLKIWGPSVQLYSVRSEKNWGVGDFSDLADLIKKLGANGAGFIGLNPIHALFPANPNSDSPYSPSSRQWLNVVYISVPDVPEYAKCPNVKAQVEAPDFQWRLGDLRAKEYVDYAGVMAVKMDILKKIFAESGIANDSGERGSAFKKFVEEGGDSLNQLAVYDALMASLYAQGKNAWGFASDEWDEQYKTYQSPAVAKWASEHADEVNFYKYLQFIAYEQLEVAHQASKDAGMAVGIYRDLAVGVSSGSAEIWANSAMYCPKASVGCPPDILGPLGQNWGLPPMDPNRLFASKYEPMIQLFRSNMKSCSALRIDHAMSLLRLWWVPPMMTANNGAYIYYRVHDMIGILALESHRNKCLIIGEDMGTVPDIMKKLLPESGIHSYKVFFFETSKTDGGYISTADYPAQAMSALTTHDMATLRGFWHCEDLKLGRKLGLYPTDEIMNNLMNDRLHAKQKILDSLNWHGVLSDSVNRNALYCGMSMDLNRGMQIHMCNGSSALFSTQLEDWLEMETPVNIPGTSGDQYPNWRRKLVKNISEIFADPILVDLAARMTEARKKASKK